MHDWLTVEPKFLGPAVSRTYGDAEFPFLAVGILDANRRLTVSTMTVSRSHKVCSQCSLSLFQKKTRPLAAPINDELSPVRCRGTPVFELLGSTEDFGVRPKPYKGQRRVIRAAIEKQQVRLEVTVAESLPVADEGMVFVRNRKRLATLLCDFSLLFLASFIAATVFEFGTRTTMVHVRMENRLKAKATKALSAMGLSISDLVRITLTRVAEEQAVPFEVRMATFQSSELSSAMTRRRSMRFWLQSCRLWLKTGLMRYKVSHRMVRNAFRPKRASHPKTTGLAARINDERALVRCSGAHSFYRFSFFSTSSAVRDVHSVGWSCSMLQLEVLTSSKSRCGFGKNALKQSARPSS